jgi:hypothetical protein
MQVPVRARLLRPAGAHQRGGGVVREGVPGGGAAVWAQGHRRLVQDAEVPWLGEVVPQVPYAARTHSHVMPPPQCSIALQTPETTELKSNLAISCVVNCEGTGCT